MSSIAARYHALTKYDEVTVRRGRGLDWSTQPLPHKEIISQQRVALRPYLSFRTPGQPMPPNPQLAASQPELAQLSRILFATYGVTGVIRYGHGAQQPLRASPSAGALYPTEIYVASRGMPGLEPGIYNYQPLQHELVRLWEDDSWSAIRAACGDTPDFDEARIAIVLTGIFWRSAWRYQERGYRRVLLDTGHVVANLRLAVEAEKASAALHMGFVDDELNGLLFFDDAVESTLACVTLGGATGRGALWTSPRVDDHGEEASELFAEAELRTSVTVALHRSSCCARDAVRGDLEAPHREPADESIAAALKRRRSARRYTVAEADLDALTRTLRDAFDTDAATRTAGFMRAFLVASRVGKLEAGIYEIEGREAELHAASLGDASQPLHRLCLGQDIARDAAATVLFAAAPGPALEAYGERAYRYLHLEAGEIGEQLQVAARMHGLGACGIGGFLDDDGAALVGMSADDWVLYLVTLGTE